MSSGLQNDIYYGAPGRPQSSANGIPAPRQNNPYYGVEYDGPYGYNEYADTNSYNYGGYNSGKSNGDNLVKIGFVNTYGNAAIPPDSLTDDGNFDESEK